MPRVDLLLERVQHVDRILEPHGVDGAIRVAVIRDDDLEHGASAEPLQVLDRPILLAALCGKEGVADVRLDRFRERFEVGP